MTTIEERNDVVAVCPHCKAELKVVWFQQLRGILGKRYLYFCSQCKSSLGVSHRKGFWMG